jgi:hypothetical protein
MSEKFHDDDFIFDDNIDDFGADEECEPDIMEQQMEDARKNPIMFEDGSSTQDMLPVEEQNYPRDEHGKRSFEYSQEKPVPSERLAEAREIIRKIREEHGGPFSDHWINPGENKD